MLLELSPRLNAVARQAADIAETVLRPISRKYDQNEHSHPRELDLLASVLDGIRAGSGGDDAEADAPMDTARNGVCMASVVSMLELARGDLGLALSIPRQGLGNIALETLGSQEQKAAFGRMWLAMAMTEPDAGSDVAAILCTAKATEDAYVLNGEKVFVTAGERCDGVVVWASLDRRKGRAAIKPFLVEKSRAGIEVERLERKLGLRASDTAVIRLKQCAIPKQNLLGSADINAQHDAESAMCRHDQTRPLVAAMALGIARAALDFTAQQLREQGIRREPDRPLQRQPAAAVALERLEAAWEGARLLTLRAAWLADNSRPNAVEAAMAKARAGRVATAICLECQSLCGPQGSRQSELLEKWVRDVKVADLLEGTQQIQQLRIARRVLDRSSAQLR